MNSLNVDIPMKKSRLFKTLSSFIAATNYYDRQKFRGVELEFVDYDEIVAAVSPRPLVLNDMEPIRSEEQRLAYQRMIRTEVEGDVLNIIPECTCQKYQGMEYKGIRCEVCGDLVESITDKQMESRIWIRSPKGVCRLVNPTFWYILKDASKTAKHFSILDWLCNPNYTCNKMTSKDFANEVERAKMLGLPRGYNNVMNNFPQVFNTLVAAKYFKGKEATKEICMLMETCGDKLFTEYLPIPNKLIFLTEKTTVYTYAQEEMRHALEAANIIANFDEKDPDVSQRVKENITLKVVNCLSEYAALQYKEAMGRKPGYNRREILGTRMRLSGRCVISSITGVHNYDELHIPWTYAIGLLKTHLSNKLMQRGWTPFQIERFLISRAHVFDPFLNSLFDEIIAECPYEGLPSIFQRNPSLDRGSAQVFFVTKIKSDVKDLTISMSVQVIAAPNADFDGDAMNHWLLLDHHQYQYLHRLEPHNTVWDVRSPRTISKVSKLHAPMTETIFNFIERSEQAANRNL